VEQLSGQVLETATLCLQEGARGVLSPRLLEAAVWAAARWGRRAGAAPQRLFKLP
jgi:hypothetical protein